jgi:hypothetical protein
LVNLKTKSAGDSYPKKAIEKTVLRFVGSRMFLHGLGQILPIDRIISDSDGKSSALGKISPKGLQRSVS